MFQKFAGDPRLYKIAKKNVTDTKNTVFCLNTQNGMNCSFNKRLDHFFDDIKKGIFHKSNFSKKQAKTEDITVFLDKLAKGEKMDIETSVLLDKLIEVTGRLNLSLEAGRSRELYELIQISVAFGASIVVNGKMSTTFEQIFPQPSREEFRRRFISKANEMWRKEIKKFANLRYCCLAVDAGTTRRTSYLDFILHHSVKGLTYIFQTIKMQGTGTASNYCDSLSKGILMVAKAKCVPSVIIVDGQSGQNKALTKGDQESIYQLKVPQNASKHIKKCYIIMHQIIKVPCLCHRISNAYKKAISVNKDIYALISKFRESANFIKSLQSINFSCPTFIATRWLYDFDIISFFFKKKDLINQTLQVNGKQPFTDNDYDIIYRVIEVFRALENILSDPKTRLCSAYPLIEGASETLREIANQSHGIKKVFVLDSSKHLLSYTIRSKEAGLWFLAYSLTPKGLNDIWKRNKGERISISTADDFKVIEKKNSNHDETRSLEVEDEQISNLFYEIIPLQEIEAETCGNKTPIQNAIDALRFISGILSYEKKRIDTLLSVYDMYLNGYIEGLIANEQLNVFNWTTIKEKEELCDLADIALRLEPATCSEAAAERAISCQRLIMEPKRDNAKQELTDARLVYMRTKKDELAK